MPGLPALSKAGRAPGAPVGQKWGQKRAHADLSVFFFSFFWFFFVKQGVIGDARGVLTVWCPQVRVRGPHG